MGPAFDATGRFLLGPGPFGVKVLDVETNRLAATLGGVERGLRAAGTVTPRRLALLDANLTSS